MKPLILFAPGAGAPSTSAWMVSWAERLATLGRVATLDYPYMKEGRKMPDKLPLLVEAHAAALKANRKRSPVVLAGKSMGSRVGCHVANEAKVDALVCFGYPLRSPAGTMRDEVLLALETPILFVQGERDELCPLDLLEEVRAKMKAPSELLVVDADHALDIRGGKVARTAAEALMLETVGDFIKRRVVKAPTSG